MKKAGFDAVFFSGASDTPVYLLISNGKVQLKSAENLWGKNSVETENQLKKDLKLSSIRVACIGPSGEKRSLMAGIINDNGRAAARGGVGAVMGAKNLKAVVVQDPKSNTLPIADKKALSRVSKSFARAIQENNFHQGLSVMGTGGGTSFLVSIGDSPTQNWNTTGTESMPTAGNLDASKMEPYKKSGYGCDSCHIRCGALLQVEKGPFSSSGEVHRPEYETVAAFGTLCLNDDVESVIKANEICNLYGLDTIATGGVTAFAFECYEKGIINEKDTDGLQLTWGNGSAVVELVKKIANREGFGATLADGVKTASERIGRGSEQYAVHIGGHRVAYHDPRMGPALGTLYIADAQPGCHMESQSMSLLEMQHPLGEDPLLQPEEVEFFGDYDKKGALYAKGSAFFQLLSSSEMCALYALQYAPPVVELLKPITGWDMTWEEGLTTGRRILALRQAFNAREGITPDLFKMPKKFDKLLGVGPGSGQKIDFDMLKRQYFEEMGWDISTGRPDSQVLEELGLADIVK